MRLRIRELNEIPEIERLQIANEYVWAETQNERAAEHWLVTLENNAVVIVILVPKPEVKNVYSN